MANVELNIESLTQTHQSFVAQGQALNDLITSVTNTLQNTEWHSPAAETFRGNWQQTYLPALRNVHSGMENFTAAVLQQLERYKANEGLA
jgi:hypothetical protein